MVYPIIILEFCSNASHELKFLNSNNFFVSKVAISANLKRISAL